MTAALSFPPKKCKPHLGQCSPAMHFKRSVWKAVNGFWRSHVPFTTKHVPRQRVVSPFSSQSCVNLWWFEWRCMQWCPETRGENVARTDLDFKVRTLLTLFEYITLVLCTYVIQSCILTTSEENSNELLTLVRAWNKCSVASLFSSSTRTWGKSVQLFDLCPLAMSPTTNNFGTGKLFCMFYIKEKVC